MTSLSMYSAANTNHCPGNWNDGQWEMINNGESPTMGNTRQSVKPDNR